MKKIILFPIIFLLSFSSIFANYELETGSKNLVERFELNTQNLDKEISRKQFVETLHAWYKTYREERWLYVDYQNYSQLNNEKYFKDVDLDSDFWEKLEYFAHLWAFSKNAYFDPNGTVNQKTFFIVLNRLGIMWNLQHCKNLRICEKEADEKTYFTKWVYYRYVSKIFYKDLRKYYSTPQEYIDAGYKPFLKPNYYFPLKGQNLNGCYAFSVRNILKYKHGIWVYIPQVDEYIWRAPTTLRTYGIMRKYDKAVHIQAREYWSLDTIIKSLQAWEPVSIVYWWDYTDWKTWQKKKVKHIVAAYSFDEKWVWVSETISAQRKRIAWDEIINTYGNAKVWRVFKYYYDPMQNWSESELQLEKENNFLAWEK